jgi:hypothetical protein
MMNAQVTLVFILTFIIHLISTLSYALRIAGIRTRRIAISLALFNVLVLISRTSNTFQGPLLAKHVEKNIHGPSLVGLERDFRWLIVAATLATLTGIVLIPTFQRIFTKAIDAFGRYRSVPRLLWQAFSVSALREVKLATTFPAREHFKLFRFDQAPTRILIFNVIATSLLTVGVFASLYAGCLKPELRVTANNLSPVVNALSTILLFVFIDPYLSLLTDDVIAGKATDAYFRKCVALFSLSRLIGTVLAQFILVPAARIIAIIAEIL